MRKVVLSLAAIVALGVLVPRSAAAVEVDSKAQKITFTGRVQPMWSTSSIENGDPSNEFLVRRARAALKVKVNDWVSGVVEADFGEGDAVLKDGFFKLEPSENVGIMVGQTKRRFDLFELTSSTQMLVIERDGRIGRVKVPTYSYLTESLGFADRDLGLFVAVNGADERILVEAAVTNGAGANKPAQFGEKAFQGRISLVPMKERDFQVNVGASVKPFEKNAATDEVGYAPAFEGSLEYGNFKSGVHLQAGFVGGKNWDEYILADDSSPTFMAAQGILTYKKLFGDPKWFEAVEPLVRLSWADPDTDVDKNGGILVTPGCNLFVTGRTRLSANVDVFLPQADDLPATSWDESAVAVGAKVATWLYW